MNDTTPSNYMMAQNILGNRWIAPIVIFCTGGYGLFHFGLADPFVVTLVQIACFAVMTVTLIAYLVLARKSESSAPAKLSGKDGASKAPNIALPDGDSADDIVLRLSEEFKSNQRAGAEENFTRQARGIADTARVALVADECCIYILDEANNLLVPRVTVSNLNRTPSTLPLGDNPLEPVILNGDVQVAAVSSDGDNGFQSELAVPIRGMADNLGTLVVRSHAQEAFSEDDGDLLASFAGLVAASVVNFNLIMSYESSTRLFSSFYEISRELHQRKSFDEIVNTLLSIVQKIMPYDRISVSLMEDNGRYGRINRVIGQIDEFDEGFIFPIDEALNGWVMRRNKPALVHDLEHLDPQSGETYFRPRYTRQEKSSFGLRAFLSAPISYSEKCLGVVTVESKNDHEYTHRHEQVLVMLANNIAAALERSIIAEQLEQMAVTDEMTGLNNYRAFRQRLTEELLRAERYHNHFCLLIADIDNFKDFNDTHGHLVGDQVLKHVARIIQSSVRSIDFTARYGGEEFAAILLGTTGDEARMTAERIRTHIASTPLQVGDQQLSVTVSVGGSDYKEDATTLQSIVDSADQALYRAKDGGRNRVELAH